MAVLADHTTRSGYRVWQKGPATGHTWQQTATDPNAHDRPATIAYLTADRFTLWQQQHASRRLVVLAAALPDLAHSVTLAGFPGASDAPPQPEPRSPS